MGRTTGLEPRARRRAFFKSAGSLHCARPRKGRRLTCLGKNGANDGARTRDNLDHNQGLYQLSYVRHGTVVPATDLQPNPLPGQVFSYFARIFLERG